MEYEYSSIDKSGFAISFSIYEKQMIAKGLRTIVPKIQRKIDRIKSSPKNEGQAHYAVKIDELKAELDCLNTIINDFENDVIKSNGK